MLGQPNLILTETPSPTFASGSHAQGRALKGTFSSSSDVEGRQWVVLTCSFDHTSALLKVLPWLPSALSTKPSLDLLLLTSPVSLLPCRLCTPCSSHKELHQVSTPPPADSGSVCSQHPSSHLTFPLHPPSPSFTWAPAAQPPGSMSFP